jgi:hypothetical protein
MKKQLPISLWQELVLEFLFKLTLTTPRSYSFTQKGIISLNAYISKGGLLGC